MKSRWWFAAVLAVLLTAGLLLGGSLPNVGTGQWVAGTNMSDSRDSAASVLLNSGDTLITGGTNSNGSLQSADLYHTDGTLTPAATMNVARASHTATLLQDGRVLVTGGNTGAGAATNAAEIYDPAANSWTQVATMVSGRYGHTAGLLSDGTVAIVGGQANGAPVTGIEIYDPVANTFTQVATLLTSRTNPAIAQLTDGRVIVTGGTGTDSNGNPIVLNTAEIFDPVAGTVTAVANMNVARTAHTATTVLDSLVVVAGGSNGSADLNSIEVYTPSSNTWTLSSATLTVPRSGHLAVLLPHNNSVVITGGTSNGAPVQNADLYQQWNGAVVSGGTMNSIRVNGAGTGFGVEGLYLAAGGSGQNSTEFYRFATIKTDKPDYSPGQTVLMTGTGYQPNEMVDLNLKQDDGDPNTDTLVQADAAGNISYSSFAPDNGDVGTHFHLTATGQSSGVQAQTVFNDSNINVFAGASGVTFTLTWTGYKTNTNCSGAIQNGPNNVTGITVAPNGAGKNLGVGTPQSVELQAPALSDQGGAFQNWSWTTPLTGEQVASVGSGTAISPPTTTNPICVENVTEKNVDNGTFTANYSTTATAPTVTSASPNSGDLNTTETVVLTGTNFVAQSTVSFGSNITVNTTTVNSSTQITVNITIGANATLGARNVTVTNPGSGGGSATGTLTNGFTVNKRTTTTAVSCSPASVGVGVGTSCTATVTDNDSGIAITPAGSVSFTSSGSGNFTPAASCTLPSGTGASVSCSVTYTPTATGTGTHTITGNYGADGSHSTSSGSFNLTVSSPPSISKAFGAATIPLNTSTTLTFTITNSNGSAMNGVAFSDTLPSGLVVSTPNGLTNSCGGTPTATAGSGSVSLTGGTISGSSCTLSVNVTGTTAGVKNNTTGNVSSTNFGTGNTASASITVVAPPSISKSFNPTTIALNGTSTLTFTITNPAANTVALTGVAFTDTLPAGLTVTSGTSSVCGGTLTTIAPTSISLSGATIAAGGQCQFSVTVTGAAAGAFTNVTGAVTSTNGGTGNTASASLTVVAPPSISKAFNPNSIPLNGTTTLTFTITNPAANTVSLTGVAFTDTLPAGLSVTSGTTPECGGTLTTTAPTGISLSGATIAAGGQCQFSVTVTGTTAGSFTNVTGAVSSTNGGTGNTATANLTVVTPPSITKSFNPSTIALNGTSTLTFTITNPAANTVALTGVTFTDTLPAGLTVTSGSSSVCGGTLTTTAPTGISLSGATIAANSQCQFTVTVTGAAAGAYTNVTGAVSSTNGGTGNTATATLTVVAPPSITKSFNPTTIALNGTSTLTFTITNPAANTVSLAGVAFTDTLPAGLTVTSGSSTVCGGTLTTSAPTGISLSGATIAAGGQCQFSVTVTGAAAGAYTNVTGAVSSTNGGTGNTATANLTVIGPPSISKSFNPASIPLNGTTTLTFTVTNPAANTVSLTGVGFTDTLPTGLTVASGTTPQCGGTLTTTAPTGISLSGATIAAGGQCQFSVTVTGTTTGSFTNVTGVVSSTNGGTGNTATASLTVVAPPSIAKSFSPTTISLNGTTTLTFTITNPAANTVGLTGVAFTDTLPSGLVVSNPNGESGTCGSGTISAGAGGNTISLSGGTIAAGGSCTFSVSVTGTQSGHFTNTTGAVTSTNGGTGNTATANLTVFSPPTISKAFGVSSIPFEASTSLTFTITNPNTLSLTGVAFSDGLPAGLVVSNPNGLTGSCGSGAISAVAGSGTISLSGGTIAASSSCSFSVNVTGTSIGTKNNTTSAVTSNEGGTGTTSNTATLTVTAATTGTVVTSSLNPASYGQSVAFTATVTDSSSNAVPTGSVQFVVDGSNFGSPVSLSPASVNSSSATSQATATLSVGSHTVTADYVNVDGDFLNSNGALSGGQTVNAANTSTTITSLSANSGEVGVPVTVNFTVTNTSAGASIAPDGSVTVSDGTDSCNGTLTSGGGASSSGSCALTPTTAGTKSLVASYPGDASFNASTSAAVSYMASVRPTSTTLTLTPNTVVVGQSTTASVTVADTGGAGGSTPAGTVSFASSDSQDLFSSTSCTLTAGSCSVTITTAEVGTSPHNITAIYTPNDNIHQGTWATKTSIPVATEDFGADTINGLIYAAGGEVVNDCTFTNTLRIYNPATDSWSIGTGMPTKRRALSAAAINGKLYAVGGDTGCGTRTGANEAYDPGTDTWTSLASMPTPRTSMGVGVINGILYAVGGIDSTNNPVATVEAFDPSSNTWSTKASMPTARYGVGVAVVNGKLYAMGGGTFPVTGVVEVYDPGSDSWTTGTSMITPRVNFGTAVLGGMIYTIGGNTGAFSNVVEVYNPATATWSSGPAMPTPRSELSAVNANGIIYALGGLNTGSYSAANEALGSTAALTVNKADTQTTITANTPNPSVVGQAVNVSASVAAKAPGSGTPTGSITVSDGVGDSCTITLSSGSGSCSLTPVAAGTITLTATYNGDSNYNTSTSAGVAQTVNKADTTTAITANAPNPSVVNQAVSVSATVTVKSPGAGTPTGTVTVSDGVGETCTITLSAGAGSCSLTPQAAGTDTLTAHYNGDPNFNASTSAGVSQTINTRHTTTTVNLNPSTAVVNQNSIATVTVTDDDPNGAKVSPTGIVGVASDSGDTISGTCTLSSSTTGVSTCQVTVTPNSLGTGTHNITASFSATTVHSASSGSAALTVHTRATKTTVSFSNNPVVVNQSTTVTVTVMDVDPNGTALTPTGTITLTNSGAESFTGGPCVLSGSAGTAKCSVTLTPAAAGNHLIGASFSATGVHSASSDSETLTVNTRHTTTAVTFSPNPVVVNQASTVTVTVTDNDPAGSPVTPTGMITLGSNVASDMFSATTCMLAGSGAIATCQVTVMPETASPTLHGISAAYPTDSVHTGSGDSENLTVNTRHTSTTVSFSINPVKTGESTTVTATVTDDDPNGSAITPAGTVTLSSSVGSDVFSATTCALSGAGAIASCTVTLTPDMVSGGSHTITASYPADAIHSASTGNNALTVQKADTTTAVSTSASTITLGDTVTFTATVTVNPPGAGTPTGLVTFFDGATPLGSGTLSGNDQATFSTSLLVAWAHAHTITAAYDGDANFNASPLSSAINETVNERTTTTGVVLNPTTVVVGQPSTATVTVTDSGSVPPGTADTFTTTGAPGTGRTGFTSTLFADGLVLLAGGTDVSNNVLKSAEIYSVSGAAFSTTGNLNTARTGAVAVLLPNGKVLVAGGSSNGLATGALNTAELFDPSAGTFTLSSHNMTVARFGTTATLLNSGKVLIAGGANSGGVLNSAELYDPVADTFTATGNLNTSRTGAAAVLLGSGKALITGGSSDGTSAGALSSAEVFDPGAGAFSNSAGTLSAGRWQPEAALLLSGKVLVAGGQNSGGALASADIYDPVADSFTLSASQMSQTRTNSSAVALSSGMVLLAGGTTSQAVDLYDEDNDRFDSTGSLQQSDSGLVATLLNNGDVLVVGLTSGGTPAADAELYSPSFNPLGTVTLTSSEATDSITGACTLTPSTSTASTCTSTVTPSNVATSPHTITGSYPADAVHTGSSNTAALTVNPAPTSTTVSSSANPSIFGQSVTFTATVSNTSGVSSQTPTGTVQFYVDGSAFGSAVTISGSGGTATATSGAIASLTVNGSPHSVKASYVNADGNFVNSNGTLNGGQTVTPASTTTTVVSSANPSIYGQGVTFTATVTNTSTSPTPTGSVQFVVDGANFGPAVPLTASGTATSGSISTLSVSGSPHSVTAKYTNSDGNFLSSAGSLSGGQKVTPAATSTSVVSSLNPSIFGQSVTFTATITNTSTSPAPTGAVQFVIDGVNFGSPVAVTAGAGNSSTAVSGATATLTVHGSPHTLVANYLNSDGNFSNSSGTLTPGQIVQAAATSTAVSSSINPSTYGQAVSFTATVSNSSGTGVTPTGSVQFVVDGANFGPPVALTAPGTATSGSQSTLSVAASPHSVTAIYTNTDGNFLNSNGTLTPGQTVQPAATSTAVSSSANPSIYGQGVTFTATVTNTSTSPIPTGSVQFVVDGGNFGSPVPLTAGGTATSTSVSTLTVVGSPHTVTANYLNSDKNFSNSSGTLSGGQTITAAPLTITASSGSYTYGGPVFVVTALYSGFVNKEGPGNLTALPTCAPIFNSTGTPAGPYVSSCAGAVDPNYTFTYVNGSVTVNQATTTISVTPSPNPATFMQLVTITATVTPQYAGTPTGTVTFYNNGSQIGTGTLSVVNGQDVATFSTSSLPDSGADNITATYGGDNNFLGSTSGAVTESVNPAPVVSLSPMFLAFGNQNVNTSSTPAKVTLSNIGDATLNISSGGITITGSNASEFSETNNCGSSLAAGKSCTINVTFSPVDTGVAIATLQITDNDDDSAGAQQTVALSGAGLSTITGGSLYTDAIFATANACGSLTLSGGSTVDSFNSAQGYNASHVLSGGNVGTNGNVTLNGSNSAIYGTAAVDSNTTGACTSTSVTGLTSNGGAKVAGGLVPLNGPITYPVPPAPSPAPPTTTQNISGSCPSGMTGCTNTGSKIVSLAPGQYGNLTVSGGTTIHFSTGTYNINSFTLSGKSILYVDSGPVVVNLAGASLSGGNPVMDVTGGSIQNPSGMAANLQFTYAGSRGINLSGGSGSYATVYAPKALVNMSGGTDFFGSIIGSTITSSGGTAVHYDTSLPAIQAGNFIWFTAVVNNVSGLPSNSQVKLYLTNSSISFTAGGAPYTVAVPNAVVTFNSSSSLKTSYDLTNSRWSTSIPKSDLTGNTFVAGVAFQVPSNFPTGIQNVTWSAAFSTDTPGITLQWQWGAAVYSSFSTTYATNSSNNVLGVNAEDGSADPNGADPAGTPETYKGSLLFGATGGGLNNYIGFLTPGAGVVPTIAPMSVSPSSLDFLGQSQGTTSAAMTAVLTNNDSATHNFSGSGVTIMGTDAGDFTLASGGTNNCLSMSNLASGASCTLYVTFTPSDIGTRTAKIVINDDANNSPQTVYLTGTGQ